MPKCVKVCSVQCALVGPVFAKVCEGVQCAVCFSEASVAVCAKVCSVLQWGWCGSVCQSVPQCVVCRLTSDAGVAVCATVC